MNRLHKSLVFCGALLSPLTANAATLTYNSLQPADNAATRSAWLNAIGITVPQYLVDFETGFTDEQNISGVTGLFPGGLVITDTSSAGQARIEATAGGIGGSNPVGGFAVKQNEQPYLQLNFSSNPIDYLGFQDIDHTQTNVRVTFVGGGIAQFSINDTTGASGNSAEWYGLFRNDMNRITLVELDASGDGTWGIDNLEYGVISSVPLPAAAWLFGSALLGLVAVRRKN